MTVKGYSKNFLFLCLFTVSLRVVLGIIQYFFPDLFTPRIIDAVLTGFFLISVLTMTVIITGFQKDPEKRVVQTILAISLKTFLTMVFAAIFFLVSKKKDIGTVLLFFLLYLGFTLFVVFTLLNLFKKESLKKREI